MQGIVLVQLILLIIFQLFAFKRQQVRSDHRKSRGELSVISELDFGSILILLLLTAAWVDHVYYKIAVLSLYATLNFVLISAIVSLRQFGVSLNFQAIKAAFLHRTTLATAEAGVFSYLKQVVSFNLFAFPFIYVGAAFFIVFEHAYCLPVLVLSLIYSIFLAKKVKVYQWYWHDIVLLLMITAAVILLIDYVHLSAKISGFSSQVIVCCLILLPIILQLLKRFFLSPYFPKRSTISRIFFAGCLKWDPHFVVRSEDRDLICGGRKEVKASPFFGCCKDANIILVTIESASAVYGDYDLKRAGGAAYFKSRAKNAWCSNMHVCLSPNTGASFYTLYKNNYFTDHGIRPLSILRSNDYQNYYLTPEAENSGLDYIEDLSCFNSLDIGRRQGVGDEGIFQQLFGLLEKQIKPNKKLFLHLKNELTHPPYGVIHSTPADDELERYQQSLVEADAYLPRLMQRLSGIIDLDNTIVIYTGDHGQSFGELGYRYHSTSIIRPQIQVPFLLSHPALRHRSLPFSSHLDIFPTLFDLLGIEAGSDCVGTSLGHEDVPFSHTLFSELRAANLPACFGHINKQRKLFLDVGRDQAMLLDHNDNIIQNLNRTDKHYYQQLMLRLLKDRGLIDRSLRVEYW